MSEFVANFDLGKWKVAVDAAVTSITEGEGGFGSPEEWDKNDEDREKTGQVDEGIAYAVRAIGGMSLDTDEPAFETPREREIAEGVTAIILMAFMNYEAASSPAVDRVSTD